MCLILNVLSLLPEKRAFLNPLREIRKESHSVYECMYGGEEGGGGNLHMSGGGGGGGSAKTCAHMVYGKNSKKWQKNATFSKEYVQKKFFFINISYHETNSRC